jgi:hypothetical protein
LFLILLHHLKTLPANIEQGIKMDDETSIRLHNLVNALTNTKTFIPLSIKSGPEGDLILRNLKDPSIVKISSNSSELHYSNGKRNHVGEYDFVKTADVIFDGNNKPTTETMSKIISAITPGIRVAAAEKEMPTVKASEISEPRKEEKPKINLPPKIEMPKEKEINVAYAGSPIDRLAKKEQEGKGKAERIKTGNIS